VNYFILGLFLLILILVIVLSIAVKTALSRGRKARELEAELEAAQREAQKTAEYHHKKEEIQNHAEEQKETLHTGDTIADFNNSLRLLHDTSKNRRS
jgi:predicted Holliday junction resolvase-like endonuclease